MHGAMRRDCAGDALEGQLGDLPSGVCVVIAEITCQAFSGSAAFTLEIIKRNCGLGYRIAVDNLIGTLGLSRYSPQYSINHE